MIPVALFDEKLEYIIAVFEKVFQNHKGKDLIRLYMKAYDAQSVFENQVNTP